MMFDKLKKRFSRKEKIDYVLPSHTEIVDMLYDKHLDFSDETVIKIVYGANNEHRVVILKNSDGYFRYIFERIEEYDADEMKYFSGYPDRFPAEWREVDDMRFSAFGSEKEAWNDLIATSEYKTYFNR